VFPQRTGKTLRIEPNEEDQAEAREVRRERAAQRFSGTVVGTVVAAGVLAASAADDDPQVLDIAIYMFSTVFVLWLAHGWAHGLGRRAAGAKESGLWVGIRHELPVLRSVVVPLVALAVASTAGATASNAITIAAWACVVELGIFGAGIARREGLSMVRVGTTAVGCATLGVAMIGLKSFVH
jgi:hypothetical protein